MRLTKTSNSEVSKKIHHAGGNRDYTVTFIEHTSKSFQFKYIERPTIEYIFNKGFAISGAKRHGRFGIVVDDKFYCDEFSKDGKPFRRESDFWAADDFEDTFNLNIKNIPTIELQEEINLWFNIGEYWHWFCEDVPLIEQFRTNAFPIISNKLNTWQKESLIFFPDIATRLVEVDTPCILKAPAYHTFSYPAISRRGKTSSWVPKFLHENMGPSVNFKPTEKIYISRGDAQARVVENENQVKEYLKSKGFVCYDNFSQLNMQQKIDAFAKAAIVVGPTGSNLTHCTSMQSGSTIIDFNHSFELENECGWNSLGTGIGINWYSFPATTGAQGPRSGKGLKQKNNNLIVDIEILKKAITHVVG